MAKSDYGRDMYRQLTEVMARLEKVEEKSRETNKKHETEIRDLKAAQKEEIRQIREEHRKEKETLAEICPDHVHMLVNIPPKIAVKYTHSPKTG